MSLRLDMVQVAAKAMALLPGSTGQLADFVLAQLNGDGGFRGRGGHSDLYYTVFGLLCLEALDVELPCERVAQFLRAFGAGEQLDLVDLCCLSRCWAAMPQGPGGDVCQSILTSIKAHRSADGGYNLQPHAPTGTAYACFLALGAHQDLGVERPDPVGMLKCIDSLRSRDGGYGNEPNMLSGTTPTTAAVAVLRQQLDQPCDKTITDWLLRRHCPQGGFFALPAAPVPDLLSTATAIHALAVVPGALEQIKRPCLGFIKALWNQSGGFCSNWLDRETDCEFTFYGLLALGSLSN